MIGPSDAITLSSIIADPTFFIFIFRLVCLLLFACLVAGVVVVCQQRNSAVLENRNEKEWTGVCSFVFEPRTTENDMKERGGSCYTSATFPLSLGAGLVLRSLFFTCLFVSLSVVSDYVCRPQPILI